MYSVVEERFKGIKGLEFVPIELEADQHFAIKNKIDNLRTREMNGNIYSFHFWGYFHFMHTRILTIIF